MDDITIYSEKHRTGPAYMKRFTAVIICFAAFVLLITPSAVYAKEPEKTVRVGWYVGPSYNTMDRFGRRSGYAYEYQRKIASYTGWDYEYVEGSWSELLEMLKSGEIDILSDVSYTEERSGYMLFPSYPMGTEEYYLSISSDNRNFTQGNYSYFNGKKIGVNKGSVQADFFREWAKLHGVNAELVDVTGSEADSIGKVISGELDAYIVTDTYGEADSVIPVAKIGASDYYFAVNKDRPDLLRELDTALGRIQDEDRFYNHMLYDKYIKNTGANLFLNSDEVEWLNEHGRIRVGYQDNYLAYCAKDKNTGELIGALSDYLNDASDCMANAHLDFEPISYDNSSVALEALKNGEVDCIFPVNLGNWAGEDQGVNMTATVMEAEIYVVVRSADRSVFFDNEQVTVAVAEGDINYDTLMMDYFPDWKAVYYPDTKSCLLAVAEREADCYLISNYRYNNLHSLCEKYDLTALDSGVSTSYCFAVREDDTELYSILSRVSKIVPAAMISAALTLYFSDDSKVGVVEFIRDNPIVIVVVLTILIAMLYIIIAQNRLLHARMKAKNEGYDEDDRNKRIFIDDLTSLRNREAFVDYIQEMQNESAVKGQQEFAVCMCDCDDLKPLNDKYGNDKGDICIKKASHFICRIFEHSPVFRTGGDKFTVILMNEDYNNRDKLMGLFEMKSREINASAENIWDQVHVSTGIAVFDPRLDGSINNTIGRAESIMYDNKRANKKKSD